MPADRIATSLYDQDLDAWAMSQAAALRSAGDAVARGADGRDERLRALRQGQGVDFLGSSPSRILKDWRWLRSRLMG